MIATLLPALLLASPLAARIEASEEPADLVLAGGRVVTVDAAGTEYAFDLELTQGFYLVLVSYFCLRALRDAARAWSTKVRDEDE